MPPAYCINGKVLEAPGEPRHLVKGTQCGVKLAATVPEERTFLLHLSDSRPVKCTLSQSSGLSDHDPAAKNQDFLSQQNQSSQLRARSSSTSALKPGTASTRSGEEFRGSDPPEEHSELACGNTVSQQKTLAGKIMQSVWAGWGDHKVALFSRFPEERPPWQVRRRCEDADAELISENCV